MTALEALRRGDLATALDELTRQVRATPQDPAARVFLFQLLAVVGRWDRALAQLQVCAQLDPATEMMVQAYSQTIHCERLRGEIFAGRRSPLVLGEPQQWVAWLIQSLSHRAAGQADAALRLREMAFEAAPTSRGRLRWRQSGSGQTEQIGEATFQWLADADATLGPILELILDGRYYWVPLAHLVSIRIEPPTDLRDLVWLPAEFTWISGGQQMGFIPVRYPGSESAQDDAIRLARKTDWVSQADGWEIGRGQRLLASDSDEYPLLDIRAIDIEPSPGELPPPAAEGQPSGPQSGERGGEPA